MQSLKGDFTESYDYFKKYYDENFPKNNSEYNLVFNNCSTVTINGLKWGELQDGTSVAMFMDTPVIGTPNNKMNTLQEIFYNSEFTYTKSHKVINDLLWEKRNGSIWNRSKYQANRLEKLY